MLRLELTFEKLVDAALQLEAIEKEKDSNDEGNVRGNPNKMKFFHKSRPFHPSKKKKHRGSFQSPATASAKPFSCFNCGAPDHPVRKCPKPKRCLYCKKERHLVSACPKREKVSRQGHLVWLLLLEMLFSLEVLFLPF